VPLPLLCLPSPPQPPGVPPRSKGLVASAWWPNLDSFLISWVCFIPPWQLGTAASGGNVKEIRSILDDGAEINSKNEVRCSHLLWVPCWDLGGDAAAVR